MKKRGGHSSAREKEKWVISNLGNKTLGCIFVAEGFFREQEIDITFFVLFLHEIFPLEFAFFFKLWSASSRCGVVIHPSFLLDHIALSILIFGF
jgi:hypothetical protein